MFPCSGRARGDGGAAGGVRRGGGRPPGAGRLPPGRTLRRLARAARGAAQPLARLHAAPRLRLQTLAPAQLAQLVSLSSLPCCKQISPSHSKDMSRQRSASRIVCLICHWCFFPVYIYISLQHISRIQQQITPIILVCTSVYIPSTYLSMSYDCADICTDCFRLCLCSNPDWNLSHGTSFNTSVNIGAVTKIIVFLLRKKELLIVILLIVVVINSIYFIIDNL